MPSLPLDLDALVPDAYTRFRPVIVEGLAFFLARLAPERRSRILARQAALPADAGPPARLVTLLRECPVLHKLGQVVARHRALAPEARHHLAALEMDAPRTPYETVAAIIERELAGALTDGRIEIEPAPLAEASVAVVVPCRWRAGPGDRPRAGVVKVLKPGVSVRLEEELAILADLATFLDEQSDRHGLPAVDHRDTFETVAELLRHEVHPDAEQAHLRAARRFYRDTPDVLVPRVLPASTPHLTVMERVYGARVTDAASAPGGMPRRALARLVVRALLADPVLAREDVALVHADPHAGNLFITDDGRLAILDWSLVTRLGPAARTGLATLVLAALRLDGIGLARGIADLATHVPDRSLLEGPVAAALREMVRGRFPGPGWLAELLDGVALRGVRFPAELALFRKTLFTLQGVVADIDPHTSLDAVLMAAAARGLAAEWPCRLVTPITSRAYTTHVSTGDLLGLWASAPATAARWWAGAWIDRGRTLLGPPAAS